MRLGARLCRKDLSDPHAAAVWDSPIAGECSRTVNALTEQREPGIAFAATTIAKLLLVLFHVISWIILPRRAIHKFTRTNTHPERLSGADYLFDDIEIDPL